MTLQLDTYAMRVDEAMASGWSRWQWRDQSACRGMTADPAEDVFFRPDSPHGIGERLPAAQAREVVAKAICAPCPVQAECLGFALATGQRFGVWGGPGESELDRLRRARRHATAGTEAGAGVAQ